MKTETHWYYTEWQPEVKRWESAFYGYKWDRATAVAKMEWRKESYPKAKLRLVCETREVRDYRERNK